MAFLNAVQVMGVGDALAPRVVAPYAAGDIGPGVPMHRIWVKNQLEQIFRFRTEKMRQLWPGTQLINN